MKTKKKKKKKKGEKTCMASIGNGQGMHEVAKGEVVQGCS